MPPPRRLTVLRSPRFLGLDADVVGACRGRRSPCGGTSGQPNGELDGHFSVVLATRGRGRTLVSVVLARDQRGSPVGPGAWTTAPRYDPLGIAIAGKRLKVQVRSLGVRLPGSTKGVRLDLYANDLGTFVPGERFRVIAATKGPAQARADGVESPWLTLPAGRATLSASFAGRGEDFIGTDPWDPKPNGRPDAHFRASLDTKRAWRILTDVVVQRVDVNGGLLQEGWDANPGPRTPPFFLLVMVNGHRVPETPGQGIGLERCNAGECPIYVPLPPSAAPYRLDVYGDDPDPGLAVTGQRFRVTPIFSDQELASHRGLKTFDTVLLP